MVRSFHFDWILLLLTLAVPGWSTQAGVPVARSRIPLQFYTPERLGEVSNWISDLPDAPDGWKWYPAGQITVPILLYHHISWDVPVTGKQYSLNPDDFASQIQNLYCWGYSPLPLSYITMVIREGGWLPPHPVVISFDDGYADVITNALPILNRFGFTATAFIIVQQVDVKGYMDWNQIQALERAGWEIGSHSYSHANLRSPLVSMRREIQGSMEDLDQKLDQPVRIFSYPYSSTSAYVKRWVEQAGYWAAVGTGGLYTHTPEQLFFLSRINVTPDVSLAKFASMLPWAGELVYANGPTGLREDSDSMRNKSTLCPNLSIYTTSR